MTTETNDQIAQRVQQSLKEGPYACTSLSKLSGGTANFVYRGALAIPLKDGTKTVVIKHTEGYVAQSPGFKLTTTRCDYEQKILEGLHNLSPSTFLGVTVRTPHLYHFSSSSNTQIYSDLPSSLDLKTYALTHSLSKEQCQRLGHGLGLWTTRFHEWANESEQEGLVKSMRGNEEMKKLKFRINYENLVGTIDNFPEILEGSRQVFEKVRDGIRQELEDEGKLIHGDFWSGNVLIPNGPIPTSPSPITLYVIDWELSQVSSLAFDMGQMFAELFELKHYKDIDAGIWLIESFMDGYGNVDEELAFRIAVHVGVHLIGFGSKVQGWGTEEQVKGVVEVGRGFVINGWEKKREFFKGGPLECLFR